MKLTWRMLPFALLSIVSTCWSDAPDSVAQYMAAVEGPQHPDRKGYDALTIEQLMQRVHVPGAAVAVIKDFKVHWSKAYGVADV